MKCITCKCNQVGEAKTIGKNNELHCIQVGPRTEPPRIQVFQHCPHTADSCVGKQHLKGTHTKQGFASKMHLCFKAVNWNVEAKLTEQLYLELLYK